MAFKDALKRIRKERGLSQSGLAAKVGISVRNVQNWEQGHRGPSATVVLALAQALDVPAETLLAELAGQKAKPAPKRARARKGK
jgi:putative transcriptional regulator